MEEGLEKKFSNTIWKLTVRRDDDSIKVLSKVKVLDIQDSLIFFEFVDSGKMFSWNKDNIVSMIELEHSGSSFVTSTKSSINRGDM